MTGWYSAAVWIGHDNYKALSSQATGGNAAAPLWQSFMEKIHTAKGLESREIIDGTPSDYGLVRGDDVRRQRPACHRCLLQRRQGLQDHHRLLV